MATPPFANVITTYHTKQILSSDRLWEHRTLLLGDDLSPDLLSGTVRDACREILDEGFRKMVAFDWSSFKVHVSTTSLAESTLVVRVDVLP